MSSQKGPPIIEQNKQFGMGLTVRFMPVGCNRKFDHIYVEDVFAHKVGRHKSDFAETLHVESHVLWLHFGMVFVLWASQKHAKNMPKTCQVIRLIFMSISIYASRGSARRPAHSTTPGPVPRAVPRQELLAQGLLAQRLAQRPRLLAHFWRLPALGGHMGCA